MDIVNIIIYSLLTAFIAYLGFKNVSLRRNLHDTISVKIQAQINKDILAIEYSKVIQELENKKLEKSDDFVKFLSDSRESAFEYIENVQDSLTKFDKQITKIIKWNETYGATTGENPHSNKIKEISVAYKKLKSLLPENTETPNN
jgi:cell division protein FtsB